jgi:hypothetical protein
MTLIQVAVSGSVGKQVVPTNKQVQLNGIVFTSSGTNATLKIRDGNASGEVVLFARALSAYTQQYKVCHKFTKGMHVKIIGTASEAYLDIS